MDHYRFEIAQGGWTNVSPEFWNFKEFNRHAKFYWPVKGEGSAFYGKEQIQLLPSKIYYIPSFIPLTLKCQSHFEHGWVHFYPKAGCRTLLDFCDHIISFTPSDVNLVESLFSIFNDFGAGTNDEFLLLKSDGALRILLADFFKHLPISKNENHKNEEVFKQCMDHIDLHLADDLTTDQLAQMTKWSTTHFANKFSKTFNMGPKEYIVMRRMDKARKLLCTTKIPIKDIAILVGLKDPYYFSRLFKKTNGLCPKEFRKLSST